MTIEQRKQQMFDAAALSAELTRQIYELQQASAPAAEVAAVIAQKARLDADVLRLSSEVNTEVMSANLLRFMERQDASAEKILRGQGRIESTVGEATASIKKLSTEVGEIGGRLDATIGRVSNLEEAHNAHEARLGELETRVSAHETRISAAEQAIRELTIEQAAMRADLQAIRDARISHPEPDAIRQARRDEQQQ